uniref:DbpA RNA binding domain-containing protein n=1 Tax=uncultured Arthrobacter sp. TaxID=114050 RepID=UPI0025E02E91
TLAGEDVAAFRDLISTYEQEHNVPAAEIAAALAVMAQGGNPILVQDIPVAPAGQRERAEGRKDAFGSRGPTRTLTEGNATYRIAVGRRQRVMPGSIVGAIANEGGLSSSQIGGIDIRADHTLVELPAELSKDQWRALSKTRIGGELIHLELDKGRKPSRERPAGEFKKPFKKEFSKDSKDFKKRDGDTRFANDATRKPRSGKAAGAGLGRSNAQSDQW